MRPNQDKFSRLRIKMAPRRNISVVDGRQTRHPCRCSIAFRAIFLSIESIRRSYRSFRSVRARPGFEKSSTENCACHSYRGCDSNDASSDWQPRASHKTGTQRALDSLVCNAFTLSDRQANNLALLSVKQIRNKGTQLILYKLLPIL